MENPFLNVEHKIVKELGEVSSDNKLQQQRKHEGDEGRERANVVQGSEIQIFESFVKEKDALIAYFHDVVRYAAHKQGFDAEKLLKAKTTSKTGYSNAEGEVEEEKKENEVKIKTESEWLIVQYRIQTILIKYQEQASVLDTILEQLIAPVMVTLREFVIKVVKAEKYEIPPEIKALFVTLVHLCSVRGYKTVVKFFPHEVSDMELVTELLHFQDNSDWRIPYILLLWLSIIVLVPFDLSTIDSQKNQEDLVKRIVNIGRTHMDSATKTRDGAAIMLSKLITRPDVVKSGETSRFLEKLVSEFSMVKDDAKNIYFVTGVMQTLVETFKTGHRDDLLPCVDAVFDPVLKASIQQKFMRKSTHLKKARANLAQRIGCIFLKPKVAKWRYQRGNRNLAQNLKDSGVAAQIISNTINTTMVNEDDEKAEGQAKTDVVMKSEAQNDVDEESDEDELEDEQIERLEFIIEFLLSSLKDDENVVRWTSAKGLGRITMRLSSDFADQIVEQLSELFRPTETDSAWHGGCLALAELCRRGLLLPGRLANFVPVLEKALTFDINLGNHSVGAHVRDAACYVVWSFARAYSPDIMRPHVMSLATNLVNISLFDREVNCRRAASATFQEAVGRQGTFPHGIEILTEADYFTLSNRVNSFLNVSCFVGQFTEYLPQMLTYLAFTQLKHWEPSMRQLASQALAVLSVFDPKLICDQILPKLLTNCFSPALHIRHGAILGISEIIIGLSGKSAEYRQHVLERAFKSLSLKERKLIKEQTANQTQFSSFYESIATKNHLAECMPEGSPLRIQVRQLLQEIENKKLCKGKGGEIMRGGVCHLIHALSQADITFERQEIQQIFGTLLENVKQSKQEIQEAASQALASFTDSFFASEAELNKDGNEFILDALRKLYKQSAMNENRNETKGYNMAFGSLSKSILEKLNVELIDTLIGNCVASETKLTNDAETRRQAVKSLISVVERLGMKAMDRQQLCDVREVFYKALDDYEVDRRGDVGSWVREESMLALGKFIRHALETQDNQLLEVLGATQAAFYERFVGAILQQLAEKIDKVREVAGRQLQQFFKNQASQVCDFAEKDRLQILFSQEEDGVPQDGGALDTAIQDEGIGYLPWRSADFVFDQLLPFFDSPKYSLAIFKGLLTCSGGLTESTLKASSHALFKYLSSMKGQEERKLQFLRQLLTVFELNLRDDRVSVPLMKTIETLLESDYLSEEILSDEILNVHSLCVKECNKSKNIVKLMAAIGVFANMLQFQRQELAVKALRSLLFLLYHNFPKVRDTAAQKLYTALVAIEEFEVICPGGEDDYDEAIDQISATDWSLPVKVLKEQTQISLYAKFGQQVKSSATVKSEERKD